MSQVLVTESHLQNIADAIRFKNGATDKYTVGEMATAIAFLPTGGSGGTSSAAAPIILRNDAELVDTYTADEWAVADLELTIPAYSTTATTLQESSALGTFTYDTDYNYFITARMCTYPTYSVATKAKGRQEYSINAYTYDFCRVPPNTFKAILQDTYVTSANTPVSTASYLRDLYWSSGTALAVYTATTYGVWQVGAAPTISGTTVTINAPSITIRGHTTYLTSTYYNAITDIRRQYIIEVWRAPSGNLDGDGWTQQQQALQIIDGVVSSTHTIT